MFTHVSEEPLQGGKINRIWTESSIYVRRGTAKKVALSERMKVRRIVKDHFFQG
jgi:hypothetical protein